VAAPLVCPGCGRGGELSDRFCADCGSPLVHAGVAVVRDGETAERARKIHPPYAEGDLVRVATAQNQPEAEMVQNLLLDEAGVPSLVRRSGGFDVPDFLAAGPRDVLVPQSGATAARELLGTTAPPVGAAALPRRGTAQPWVRALAAALAVVIFATVAAGVLTAIWR
jgi:hypothetical protein